MRLLERLGELQEAEGYLKAEALEALARAERVPLYRIQELVSFYPHFRTSPPPRVRVALCRDMCCWLAGAAGCHERIRRSLEGAEGVEIHEVSCLGRCDRAPAAAINDVPLPARDAEQISAWAMQPDSATAAGAMPRRIWRCDPYPDARARYGVLRELLGQGRDEAGRRVLVELKESGLRGRGGAGFPASAKWELVRGEARTPKYVICNADESEPGTFKDRVLLAEVPHLVIEGMVVAGLTVGAAHGILFIRHEYEPERRAFQAALEQARADRLIGRNVLGSGWDFELAVFVSPGGYILGEETALLEALEDRRGEPRNKPPFPGTHGLHGLPTLINNVETLAMVPAIVRHGSVWWKGQGRPGFAGLKIMAVSGHVERPGVYEVPVGMTVRELIELAGGVAGGQALKAFAPGGASSQFLPASQVDLALDFEPVARAGSMLGSGALVVVAEGTDMLALAANVVRFFRNESCGKCVPCRVGTEKAAAILDDVSSGQRPRRALELLPELAEAMTLTSICGLGQAALNPALSVLQHWPDEARRAPA
jgi:NADH:ubiquinone oxidoreductase subunit F (NADH-binding)/NADH:ubiquinone oxidoreductase subunit E